MLYLMNDCIIVAGMAVDGRVLRRAYLRLSCPRRLQLRTLASRLLLSAPYIARDTPGEIR